MYASRLIKGLLYAGLAFAFCMFCNVGYDIYHYFLDSGWTMEASSNARSIFNTVFGISAIAFIVKGYFFIKTCHLQEVPEFEHDDVWGGWNSSTSVNTGQYSEIGRVMTYRNGLMCGMSNQNAAKEFAATSWVDGMFSRNGNSETERALGYVNGRVAGMSNESALNWLKSGAK